MKVRIVTVLFFFLIMWEAASGQTQPLTLKEARERIEEAYPLALKAEVRQEITELNRRIARSGWFPEIEIGAQASYRSDVTEVPFSVPGTEPPEFSKDHYNLSMEVTQSVFDGGRTSSLQDIEQFSGEAEQAGIESELLEVRSQLEEVWFGILMMEKQEEILKIRREDIREQMAMVASQVRNGVSLPGDEMVLKAELIRSEQELAGIAGDIRAGYAVLEELLDVEFVPGSSLELPEKKMEPATEEVNRPEYDLFEANQLRLDSQKKMSAADKLPSISVFGTTAYGRPGLNVFEDDLQFYWIVGLRARWSFKNNRNASIKIQALEHQRRQIDADRDAFTRQLNAGLRRSEVQIATLREQIRQDEEVLELSIRVTDEKRNRLERGVITSTEYVTELNAENRARLNLEIRKIRLIRAITEYETKRGISWE